MEKHKRYTMTHVFKHAKQHEISVCEAKKIFNEKYTPLLNGWIYERNNNSSL